MPALGGDFIPVLRVADVEASGNWYQRVLGLIEVSRYSASGETVGQIVLGEPTTGLTLCLVGPGPSMSRRFDEFQVGLDHLEIVVPDLNELSRWAEHLDALGVPHSGIKAPDYTAAAMITIRDPDNIQLELFCHKR